MARVILPDRRPNATRDVTITDGRRFEVCIGYDLEGRPKEVFATGAKVGSETQHIISDACVLVSIAMQHGISPADLGKSLGRVPAYRNGEEVEEPASVVGFIVAALEEADG